MNVFVDSNILLGFYAFSNERLDALENALGLHVAQQVTLWLTEQVRDEVERNREQKIAEALYLSKRSSITKCRRWQRITPLTRPSPKRCRVIRSRRIN